jgi:bis(5'-nucleosyl)-tetraphosphatase (symmetrical)
MATYAVGDVQGCYAPLVCLLDKVGFNKHRDQLWFVGDLVNRGPQSLEVLRLAKFLGKSARVVLGNHDLHLLAVAYGLRKQRPKDTFDAILAAPDKQELMVWLRAQPLFYADTKLGYVMVHAGIPPGWSLAKTEMRSREVQQILRSRRYRVFLDAMYGNEPARWNKNLKDMERLRVITNYLTRMRFCTADGTLDLEDKSNKESRRRGYLPWFRHPNSSLQGQKILFGHWAALNGQQEKKNIIPLDTGCVWGGKLTMMNLETGSFHSCKCR